MPGFFLKKKKKNFLIVFRSIGLLLQISIPCIIFGASETKVSYGGGTDVSHSPPFDEIEKILVPHLTQFGIDIDIKCIERFEKIEIKIKRGFYPKGNGIVELICKSPVKELNPITILDRGNLKEIDIITTLTGDRKKTKLAKETEHIILKILEKEFPNLKINTQIIDDDSKTSSLCLT